MGIRVAVGQFHELTEERLRFAAQIGVDGLQMNNPSLPGDHRWEEKDVAALAKKVSRCGPQVRGHRERADALLPQGDDGPRGTRRADRELPGDDPRRGARRHPGAGLHFMPNSVWTTDRNAATRGGAVARRFDMAVVEANIDNLEKLRSFMPTTLGRASSMPLFGKDGPLITEEQMWSNYEYFMKAVLPVAEEEGLKLALHPDDPPVPMLGGVARLFYKPDNFKKAYELVGKSPEPGRSTSASAAARKWSAARPTCNEMIEYFAPKGDLLHPLPRREGHGARLHRVLHRRWQFRPGRSDVLLAKNGFDGFLLDDHVPKMDGDSDWNHRGRSHAIGYMQGLIRMATFLGKMKA
jgi:mannonate dehydratase